MAGQEQNQNQLTKLMIPVVIFLFAITDWTPFLQPFVGEKEPSSQTQPLFAEQENPHEEVTSTLGEDLPLEEKPPKSEIVRVMKQVNMLRCIEAGEEPFTGKIFVQLKIINTGQVVRAVALPPIGNTPLGDCLEAEIKKLKFPKFIQESINFKYPFVIL